MRRLLVVVSVLAVVACSKAQKTAPALSPAVQVAASIVGDPTGPDRAIDSDGREVAVAFDGSSYLVVWTQPGATTGDDLWAARVSASGEVLDPGAFVVSAGSGDQQTPAVAFDGTGFMVVWQDHREGQYVNIYAARVSRAGQVLDPTGIPVAMQVLDHQARPAIAFDGTSYLVAWTDHRNGNWDVYAGRVSPSGALLDGTGFPVSAAANQQLDPAVAFDGTNYLVAWQDNRSGEANLYAARVTPGGAVLDPAGIPVSTAANVQSAPQVVFDGGEFVVVWQDLRGGVDTDVYAARVSVAGEVLDRSGIAISAGTGAQRFPTVAHDGRYVVVAWEDYRSGAQYDVYAARIDATGSVLDPSGFQLANGTGGSSLALASDRAGRVLALYDALDPLNPPAHLRARLVTDWAELSVAKAGKGGGSVTSSPGGIDCGTACSAPFDTPTLVTLTASPDGDSVFGGWSGACSGLGTCQVTIDAAKSVTATFLPLYPVTVTVAGATGSVGSSPAGIACGTACSARFVEGTSIRLGATATAGKSVFSAWSGACTGTTACSIVVDGPKSVTATFVPAYVLTLNRSGAGNGALSVAGTTCSAASCPVDVATGSTVVVTASPDASSILKTWSGCVSSAETACTVTMTSSRSVTARLEPSALTLTGAPGGTGAGRISGAGLSCTTGSTAGCTAPVPNPPYTTSYETVSLAAAPLSGSVFKSWSGCTPLAEDPAACSVYVSSARTVGAKFEPSTIALAASTTGNGSGTVSGAGLACTTGSSAGCTTGVDNPGNTTQYTTVTLGAAPGASSVFKSWSGCSPVATDPRSCTVYVSSTRSVSAKFETSMIPLSAGTTGAGAGTITGAGLACTTGATTGCTAAVRNPPDTTAYDTVTLSAVASGGSVFKSWSGCAALADAPASCSLMVNAAKTVYAKFEPSTYPLTVAPTGTGTGGGTVTGAGLACTTGSTAGCTVDVANPANTPSAASVILKATPDASSVFKSWSGCAALADDPTSCTVVVSGAKTVYARFEPSTYQLTVALPGTGAGTVGGAGLSCTAASPSGCSAMVANGATVTLTASPGATSFLKAWSGCSPSGNTCTVVMTSPKTVNVTFEPTILNVAVTGTGGGTVGGSAIACATGSTGTCTATVVTGTTVTLTATPDASSFLKSWTGCTAVDGSTCTVDMSVARNVTASFAPTTFPLTVTPSGAGGGTVTGGAGAAIACTTGSGAGCSANVANGATVTLTAQADASSIFKSWSGCTQMNGNVCTVTMTAARNVYATFQPSTYALTAVAAGTGRGNITGLGLSCTTGATTGCTATVANGDTVTLYAAPEPGSIFKWWSGCTSAVDTACTVTMTSAKTVTATFQPSTYPVAIAFSGLGAGEVTDGTSICASSSGGCTFDEANGATVTLRATPAAGAVFGGWSGSCGGTGDCTLIMSAARSVRAAFSPQ